MPAIFYVKLDNQLNSRYISVHNQPLEPLTIQHYFIICSFVFCFRFLSFSVFHSRKMRHILEEASRQSFLVHVQNLHLRSQTNLKIHFFRTTTLKHKNVNSNAVRLFLCESKRESKSMVFFPLGKGGGEGWETLIRLLSEMRKDCRYHFSVKENRRTGALITERLT